MLSFATNVFLSDDGFCVDILSMISFKQVPEVGLEPTRVTPLGFESSSATITTLRLIDR